MDHTCGREHSRHRVTTLFRLHLSKLDNIRSIGGELSVKEQVHKVDLPHNINKVEGFADEEAECVEILLMKIGRKVIHQKLFAVLLTFLRYNRAVEVQDQHFDAATLPGLPEIAGDIEEYGLEEESKAHPLVVLVVFYFVPVCMRRHPRLDHILADTAIAPVGDVQRAVPFGQARAPDPDLPQRRAPAAADQTTFDHDATNGTGPSASLPRSDLRSLSRPPAPPLSHSWGPAITNIGHRHKRDEEAGTRTIIRVRKVKELKEKKVKKD
ncbi:Adhesion G protein-coupled receptor L1 [Frankliniella fusca]|uniref:Adhesion G protein-coupled receptor L1 n=1 Tax=Frankliniella fusca TaxID=407009 RepID=A0AAE1LR02_9NEOP|nr:Adhesion G protein-coupled receptor L1 [Frankliniella fusca]